MDLSNFDLAPVSNQGRFLHLRFGGKKLLTTPTDGSTPKPIGLNMLGPESKEYRQRDAQIKRDQRERMRFKKGGKIVGLEGAEDDSRSLVAAMVTEYVNITVDGDVLDRVSLDRTRQLFDRFDWIYEQAEEFLEDETAWLGEPLTS
jgi:hypothetical protein